MAKFRNVNVKFWSDPFIETLTPERKLFYLYLITNEHTTQCGIYEITFKQMTDDTGYNRKAVEKLVEFFEATGKIKYSRKTSEMAIKNFVKHNPQGSPKVKAFVDKELKNVKDSLLIAYIYATDTVSQEEQEEEETKEEEQEQEGTADAPPFEGELLKKWFEWEQHRKEKRAPITPTARKQQIKLLGGRPPNEALEILEYSLTNGYTGLFPEKLKHHEHRIKPTGTLQPTTAIIEPDKSFGVEKGFSRSGSN